MLAPATGFYGTPGLGKNEVRLAYVLNQHDLAEAMDCLEQALQQYPGRTCRKRVLPAVCRLYNHRHGQWANSYSF
jgi:aspartate aminotransferase